MPTEKRRLVYCSFCGASEETVKQMIAAPDAAICDICIERARDILGTKRTEREDQLIEAELQAQKESKH